MEEDTLTAKHVESTSISDERDESAKRSARTLRLFWTHLGLVVVIALLTDIIAQMFLTRTAIAMFYSVWTVLCSRAIWYVFPQGRQTATSPLTFASILLVSLFLVLFMQSVSSECRTQAEEEFRTQELSRSRKRSYVPFLTSFCQAIYRNNFPLCEIAIAIGVAVIDRVLFAAGPVMSALFADYRSCDRDNARCREQHQQRRDRTSTRDAEKSGSGGGNSD
jgi:hypothetical protein